MLPPAIIILIISPTSFFKIPPLSFPLDFLSVLNQIIKNINIDVLGGSEFLQLVDQPTELFNRNIQLIE